MSRSHSYYVYILASGHNGTLYIGVTNDIWRRMAQHRSGCGSEFVKKYNVTRLVYIEKYESVIEAVTREKQLKNWKRDWKIELIERDNGDWSDLSGLL
jgi:putative endonuclease